MARSLVPGPCPSSTKIDLRHHTYSGPHRDQYLLLCSVESSPTRQYYCPWLLPLQVRLSCSQAAIGVSPCLCLPLEPHQERDVRTGAPSP